MFLVVLFLLFQLNWIDGFFSLESCFDVSYPGRVFTNIPTCPSRKSPLGQKGLISCLSFNPDLSGCYAAGSYDKSIGVYVEDMKGVALELTGLNFGVTHLKWSPCGRYLWAGGRASKEISCWDLRQTRELVGTVERELTVRSIWVHIFVLAMTKLWY